ncbi:asparagine synthase (glutamine-hydrolyzing) [Bradyrhizobium sp.]|uniref:asparagine synthase (glutamine-hydrolyzing) n=1 Tax=Bradyrhizobium sp. TaxID=376 RepID=UPI003C73666A
MCGIAGFFGRPDGLESGRVLLQRMISAISHRGPDERGVFVDRGTGLGHVRLSIIDLATGRQPMANVDRTVFLSFNGEIFNYVELRQELIARGHRFATQSDTEVILHLYEEMGSDCVERFNGDFAFALWDSRCNRLMLARDRMGVRPLFYAQRGSSLVFASEIKALLEVPGISAALDPIALDQIFTLWFPLSPRTPFKHIYELPPAHVLIADSDGVAVRRYWSIEYPELGEDSLNGRNECDIADELRALFLDATRIRLRSDVTVGAYLSGGLDSSIVAAAIKSIVPDRLRTFSVTFDSPEFDESDYQNEMTRALCTEHRSIQCSSQEIASVFPAVIRHAECPILRTSPAPLFALSKLVHDQGCKVVLTGEGADEVLAGYDIFKEAKLRRFCARQPHSRFRPQLFRRLYPYLPGLQGQSQKYLESFFSSGLAEMQDPLFSHLPRFRTTMGGKIFFSDDLRREVQDYDALAELRSRLPAEFVRWDPLSQAQYLETAYLLPGFILSSQGDRVAMAHAVESRFPFLDHRVVEFAARIPPKLKIRGLREKHILREATQQMLPPRIGNRSKQPYRAPDSQSFFAPPAPDYVSSILSAASIKDVGYFDARAVAKLTKKCQNQPVVGFRDNMAFVGILSAQMWHREFTKPLDAAAPPVAPYVIAMH